VSPSRISFIVLVAAIVFSPTSEGIQEANKQNSVKTEQAAPGKQAPDVEGKWQITFDGPPGEHYTRILILHRDNGNLTGTLDAPVCPCVISGTMKGDKLRLKITSRGAMSSTIYRATVNGDKMRGESFLEAIPNRSASFTGIRQVQAGSLPNPSKN